MPDRGLTHLDPLGRARMVDVTPKDPTHRRAVARGRVHMKAETTSLVARGAINKGDVLAVARVAGIQAAKRTPELIPLCHPLLVGSVLVNFRIEDDYIEVEAHVETVDRTGVEMEALTACTVACLTIYDMCKSSDRGMVIGDIALWEKTGGRSGTYRRTDGLDAELGLLPSATPVRGCGPGQTASTTPWPIRFRVASRQWLESDAVEVFVLLGAIWAAVLVPPWLESRREARSMASIMSFRSQLWSLQRATPDFGLDSYGADGDDEFEDVADSEDAEVHALNLPRRSDSVGEAIAPGVIGAVVRPPSDGFGSRSVSALSAAVHQRRAVAYRRRRHVLSFLLLVSLAGIAPAVLLGPAWIVAEAGAVTLLVAYLALLVRRGRLEAERAQKVRYLTPIRAPRPSVVIIGSGAAR